MKTTAPYWPVPAGLILLSLIPALAGSSRLAEIATSAEVTEANQRFFDAPIPVILHIVSVTVYCLVGAFKFVPALRGRRRWHRTAGVVLVPLGFVSALTGLWMSVFYALPATDNTALMVLRLVFGTAMVAALVLGVRSLLGRDYRRHGDWMTRAYAIGVAAGTQAFVQLPWLLLFGPTDAPAKAWLMGFAWVLNSAVAEWVISRRRRVALRGTVPQAPRAEAGLVGQGL